MSAEFPIQMNAAIAARVHEHGAKCKKDPFECVACVKNRAFFDSLPLAQLSSFLEESGKKQSGPLHVNMKEVFIGCLLSRVEGKHLKTVLKQASMRQQGNAMQALTKH